MPQRERRGPHPSPLQFEALQGIESQLQLIADQNLLPEQELKDLKEEVARMAEATRESQEARWEAIDTAREKLAAEAESTLQALRKADRAASTGGGEQVEKALQDLAKKGLLDGMPPELARRLGQKGEKLLAGGSLPKDPATLDAARRYLKRLAAAKCNKLAKAVKGDKTEPGLAGLDDFEMAMATEPSFEKCKEGDGTRPSPGDGTLPGNDPGMGGITRGRADAPIVWGDESDEQKVKFQTKELPPVTIAPGDEMPVVGISIVEPEPGEPAPASASRPTDLGGSAGDVARHRTVSPRHRGVVRRYFSTDKPDTPR